MSLQWVICGAGRGVGKTTLALKLCDVLPDCRYSKCGHGEVRVDKPAAFFRSLPELESYLETSRDVCEHLVVESNALARLGRGDIIIFIDGIEGKTRFRKDTEELRSKAHLRICHHSTIAEWQKELSGQLRSSHLFRKICSYLISQKQYLFGSSLTVRSKIWFESGGAHVFGMGLARLLENVSRLGTLQKAAKASDMSYRYAWDLISSAENYLGKILIERHAGGTDGGGSVLSAEGKQMLDIFEKLNTQVARYSDECFSGLLKRGGF